MGKPIKALLYDMDGVLYHGMTAIPHAVAFIRQHDHIPHLFITNNPVLLPEDICLKLSQLGFIGIQPEQILTSGIATANYLHTQKANFTYFAIGAPGLQQALQQHGTASKSAADYVVVGEGPGINFENLVTACNLIVTQKAQLISTNPDANVDAFCDEKHCILPGGGALVAPLVVATGVKPITIGKPEPLLFEMALQKLALDAADCLMIGDRPDTDILGAQQLGMQTALVRSGRFSADDTLAKTIRPDYDVNNLAELAAQLKLVKMPL
jgi:HAD superfamily hydrolase (TIGR01457 family)